MTLHEHIHEGYNCIMNLVIVGGGITAWLAAHYLRKKHAIDKITVIDIGEDAHYPASEITDHSFIRFLQYIDIDPIKFARATNATFRTSAKFSAWGQGGEDFFVTFDSVIPELTANAYKEYVDNRNANYMLYSQLQEDKVPLHIFGANYLLTNNFSPFYSRNNRIWPTCLFSMNIDTRTVSTYLQSMHKKINVKRVVGQIASLQRGDTGNIEQIIMSDGSTIDSDFVVDCSGLQRLVARNFDTRWNCLNKNFPVTSSLSFCTEPFPAIPSFNNARAMTSGWLSSIPQQNGFNSAYYYSDQHYTLEQATEELNKFFKKDIEFTTQTTTSVGYYEHCSFYNCVLLGTASSFIEPLLTSHITTTLDVLRHLNLRDYKRANTTAHRHLNDRYHESLMTTLNNTYLLCITGRRELYWRSFSFAEAPHFTKSLVEDFFKTKDFFKFCNETKHSPLFWLAVFQGLNEPAYNKALSEFRTYARQINTVRLSNRIQKEAAELCRHMIDHRIFLTHNIEYMLGRQLTGYPF